MNPSFTARWHQPGQRLRELRGRGAFPNPAQNIIRFNGAVAPETSLTLRAGFGRQVWTDKAASGVDLSPFPTGIYLLEALIDGKRTIEKVVKH